MDYRQTAYPLLHHGKPSVLAALREETRAIHERLHEHGVLASLQAGTIARGDYIALLGRLYGHYKPLAALIGSIAERVAWLQQDLMTLEADSAVLPLQATLAVRLDTVPKRLGAEYVFEGSSLGGMLLARGARKLLGPDPAAGYRFFHGHGGDTARRWKGFATRLDDAGTRGLPADEIVSGARLTFQAFEDWMS